MFFYGSFSSAYLDVATPRRILAPRSEEYIARVVVLGIFYGTMGVLVLSCTVTLVRGITKAYRNPDQYGPRTGGTESPSRTRIQGIAKAVLDTIPVIHFHNTNDVISGDDIELRPKFDVWSGRCPLWATSNAIRELQRRIQQLEGDLVQQNTHGLPQITTPRSDVSITSPGTEQVGSPHSHYSSNNTVLSCASGFPTPPVVTEDVAAEPQPLSSRVQNLGNNWYFRGLPILSERGRRWMSSRTGHEVLLKTFLAFNGHAHTVPKSASRAGSDIDSRQPNELPSKSTTEEAIRTVYASYFRYSFPVLDDTFLHETVTKAYNPLKDKIAARSSLSAKACVWALHAISRRMKPAWYSPLYLDGEMCATRAQTLLSIVIEESCIETLQAILLVQAYRSSSGQWRSYSSLHLHACRIVCDLGGHHSHPAMYARIDDVLDEQRCHYIRELFWLCYLADKDVSFRSGRPPLLTETYCDISLPKGLETSDSAENQDIHLMMESTFRLPSDPLRRSGTAKGDESLPEDLHKVVHSSVDISLEAGRSTLIFLKASVDVLEEGAFGHISFYVPIAAMAIFVNVLIHPLSPGPQNDLKILIEAIETIQSIPLRRLSYDETIYLQELSDFIMELFRLGNSAIWKAKKSGESPASVEGIETSS
ncbi:C6 zinc finger domain-containing protein [Verticillium alfalfae VaMs.102]|uniref:C6 zinc finger domain-containing protein n=1 Tax=Verticillium alfalfae (strain VaMs.102 / ATCC MYA-4576 / FGSC 10136) TaxID=526221 RepID=C9SNA9_VERA1|nr:C6 zinc finger domain-containing protein [Verticillium alfalfae VaMs.102]EEY20274.1 C6 zinc finger domain-containing protein [Verticillium alfalfae VaMs.102]